MRQRPDGETRKDRLRQWLIGLGVLIILVALPTIAIQGYDANKSQNNHHAASVKQQNQIIALQREILSKDTAIRNAQMQNKGTLTEIASLQKQVASVIDGLPAADTELGAFAAYSIAVNEAVCADIMKVAASTGLTLTPCPTVPTLPPIG